jgi:hypothetical protein
VMMATFRSDVIFASPSRKVHGWANSYPDRGNAALHRLLSYCHFLPSVDADRYIGNKVKPAGFADIAPVSGPWLAGMRG